MKNTEAVCSHMLLVYNYLYKINPNVQSGIYITEAISLLDDWEAVSEHVYKHRPTALTLEIGRYEELATLTSKILFIEMPHMVKIKNQLFIYLIKIDVEKYIINYFKINKP